MHFLGLVAGEAGNSILAQFSKSVILKKPVCVDPASVCQILPVADLLGEQKVAHACQSFVK